jgi:hypothetical protein
VATSTYVFPQEGLDYLLNMVPRATQASGAVYLGLFTTPWSTISGYMVSGQNNILLNASGTAVAELASATGYTVRTTTSGWTVPSGTTAVVGGTTISGVRYTTASVVTFTNSSASTWSINGIFLCAGSSAVGNASTASGGATTVLWYAPFSDQGTTTVASGDSISITPTWQSLPYPN